MERLVRHILLVLLLVASCDGERDIESTELTRCEQLRDHLIDLRLADAVHVDKAAHREAMRTALGDDFAASCSKLRDDVIDCALGASDSTAAAACAR
jgi:predicted protein tyrosine phosphatase